MGQPIIAGGGSATPPRLNDDEDEWECEYDPNETEDLYFTLDLTTHVPDALVQKSAAANGSHEVIRAVHHSPSHEEDDDDGDDAPEEDDLFSRPVARLQIIDLHTTNPLVKLNDDIFSCYWSTDLGTQVHIAQAGSISKPRRPGTVLDVVGTSQARLIGKPASLKQRNDVEAGESQRRNGSARNAIAIEDESESEHPSNDPSWQTTPDPQEPGEPIKIPREMLTNRAAREQASFLERLSAIKVNKGEYDIIPIAGVRVYPEPDNVDEIRQRDLDEEAARTQQAKDEKLAAKAERPRKRRRRVIASDKPNAGGRKSREVVSASLGLQDPNQSSPPSNAMSPAGPAQEDLGTPADEDDDEEVGGDDDDHD